MTQYIIEHSKLKKITAKYLAEGYFKLCSDEQADFWNAVSDLFNNFKIGSACLQNCALAQEDSLSSGAKAFIANLHGHIAKATEEASKRQVDMQEQEETTGQQLNRLQAEGKTFHEALSIVLDD